MTEILYNIIIFPIAEFIGFLFKKFYYLSYFNVYFAIFIVSLFVNLICLPMYMQAEKIQDEECKIQDKMASQVKSIKKNFKGDERFMLLKTCYRQHNYHPIMGLRTSLNILIQIPFFMAAYLYFNNSEILQQTVFINGKTLASPDNLISIFGISINILPIIMTVINILSAKLYAKGKSLKDKIQMYSFASIFLVLLYNSPAGLVIYWTFNNLFSLIKNIVLNQKNPLDFLNKSFKVLAFLLIVKIILILLSNEVHPEIDLYIYTSYAVLLYCIINFIPKDLKEKFKNYFNAINLCNFKLFILSCLTLSIISGILIPIIVISSSTDFVEFFNEKIWNIVFIVFTKSIGLYLFCPIVLFYFSNKKIRSVLTILLPILVLISAINLCLYNGELGILSLDFVFKIPQYSTYKIILDLIIIALIILSVSFCFVKQKEKYVKSIVTCLLLASIGFSAIRGLKIHKTLKICNDNHQIVETNDNFDKPIKLSKKGKNVLIIFIDRALGFYAREIFEDNADLRDKFSGFVLYPNTVSFQGQTFLGYPPMIAGYEYNPINAKKRTNKTLKEITNEAYLVLPKIFINNGYKSTIIRPQTFIGDGDYSVYNNSNISLFKSENFDDYYNNTVHNKHEREILTLFKEHAKNLGDKDIIVNRFHYFSNYMLLPCFMKIAFYQSFPSNNSNKTVFDERIVNDYMHLSSMSAYTAIDNSNENYFTIFNNELTHINKYDRPYSEEQKFIEYEGFYVLTKYIDYLKKNNVYDNTRIIIVSDHGHWEQSNKYLDLQYTSWNPLLMIKDFNSNKEFSFNFDFMTNADTPILATDGIIDNPINPYTGKYIKNYADKKTVKILTTIIGSEEERYKIPDGAYINVHDNIYKLENWNP